MAGGPHFFTTEKRTTPEQSFCKAVVMACLEEGIKREAILSKLTQASSAAHDFESLAQHLGLAITVITETASKPIPSTVHYGNGDRKIQIAYHPGKQTYVPYGMEPASIKQYSEQVPDISIPTLLFGRNEQTAAWEQRLKSMVDNGEISGTQLQSIIMENPRVSHIGKGAEEAYDNFEAFKGHAAVAAVANLLASGAISEDSLSAKAHAAQIPRMS